GSGAAAGGCDTTSSVDEARLTGSGIGPSSTSGDTASDAGTSTAAVSAAGESGGAASALIGAASVLAASIPGALAGSPDAAGGKSAGGLSASFATISTLSGISAVIEPISDSTDLPLVTTASSTGIATTASGSGCSIGWLAAGPASNSAGL